MVIRQNRAVPILLALTLTFILYLAGCFGSEEPITAEAETPTPVATPTTPPVVGTVDPSVSAEEPFFHTIEDGDRLGNIASKYNVTADVILRANPDLNPNVLIIGQQIRVPGARTTADGEAPSGADREEGESTDYVVEGGDTLGTIANEYQVSVDAILEANPGVDPATLQINQLLVIPPRGTGLPPGSLDPVSTPVPVPRDPGEIQTHVVAAGDILSAIAETYSVTVDEILEANGLDDANQLLVGQQLLIPPPSTGVTTGDG